MPTYTLTMVIHKAHGGTFKDGTPYTVVSDELFVKLHKDIFGIEAGEETYTAIWFPTKTIGNKEGTIMHTDSYGNCATFAKLDEFVSCYANGGPESFTLVVKNSFFTPPKPEPEAFKDTTDAALKALYANLRDATSWDSTEEGKTAFALANQIKAELTHRGVSI